ncbi:MAG: 30S ribosomal protein S12 methylthiotransferase RimO [Clostridia bacterium]|nr:30S ribosomal protein S12 methylthiotransferase RimO [Clostridia bacterium]
MRSLIMMKANVLFVQLGCSKNKVDGEIMMTNLMNAGFTMVDTEEKSDVIIINTCGFIEAAKEEAISEILNAVSFGKKVVVTGCLAQRYQEEILENFPEVDAVLGIHELDHIVPAVEKVLAGEKYASFCKTQEKEPNYKDRVLTTPFYYAFLKIADGCSNGCSYCAIPKIRGKYVSRPMESVVAEAKAMAEQGVTEVIVIAQDTTRYGMDLYGEKRLVPLLSEIEKIDGIRWIRLHYLYPDAVTEELLCKIAESKKILPYFDIPIQHCNDRILKLMNRRTNKKELLNLLHNIKSKMPHATIRTSLISGFPSETVEEHEELVAFVKQGYFDRLGVFAYSTEEGTRAARITGKLKKAEKTRRVNEIMALSSQISLQKNKQKIGKSYTVLVEGIDTVNHIYFGRTYMDSPEIDGTVYFEADFPVDIGEYVTVEITGCDHYDLTGTAKQSYDQGGNNVSDSSRNP